MFFLKLSQQEIPSSRALILLIVGIWLVRILHRAYFSPLRKIPGPWYSHLTNLRLKAAVLSGKRMYYIHSLHAHYGPIVRISPTEVAVADVSVFKQIHAISSGFAKSAWYEDLTGFPKLALFSMRDRKEHAMRRRLFARPFSKTALRQTWEGLIMEKARKAVERIGEEARRVGKADVLKWWTFLATDVAAELMFGESFEMIERGEKNDFIRTLEAVMMGSGIGVELPWISAIGKHIPLQTFQNLFNANHYLLSYGEKAVANSRTQGGTKNLFAYAIATADEGSNTLTDLDIRVEAAGLIVAGSDTTGITLSYLTWAVLRHSRVRAALEEEVFGLTKGFTDTDLEGLPLLNATINETLRLYGAAPGSLPRTVPKGGVQLAGYFVPEGVTVSTQSYTLHRDPKLFTDPESFNPWRWLDTVNPLSEEAQTAFSAFGAGSRTCIGIHLAQMELRMATTLFFREYKDQARLAPETTPASMSMENFFLVAPLAHRCEITIRKN